MKTKKDKISYEHVLTVEELGVRLLMMLLAIGASVGIYFSWHSWLSENMSDTNTISFGIGLMIWLIFNIGISLIIVIMVIGTLFIWDDAPKIRVRIKA